MVNLKEVKKMEINFKLMKTEKKITSIKVSSSKPIKDRKGIMGTGKDLAFLSDSLIDDDLKK